MTPAEIWTTARSLSPGLGIATVYRALRILMDMGAVEVVEIPGAPPHYERKHPHHHHHFHCRGCDRVYDLEGCPGGLRGLLPRGFTLEGHTIVLSGKCETCAN